MKDCKPDIYTPGEEEVRHGLPLGRRLREFNYRYVDPYPESRPIWLNARSGGGEAIGGLRGLVLMHWLLIEFLWVEEACRKSGIGSALLAEAERQARELGAKNVRVETFEWQAPDFYRKHGYTEAGRLENYVGKYDSFLFRKAL